MRQLQGLLRRLVDRASPYGSAGSEAQEELADFLASHGFECVRRVVHPEEWVDHPEYMPPSVVPGTAGRADAPAVNLTAAPAEAETAPRITLFGHVDTEPLVGGGEDGPSGPLEDLEGGRMRAIGAADDKAGLAAAAVAAAAAWQAWGVPVRVLSVHGKGGGARGTLAMFSGASFSADDVAVYVHPAETGRGLAELKHRSRGVVDLTFRVEGWRGRPREIGTPESAAFDAGGNAVVAAMDLFGRLRERLSPDCELNLGRLVGGDVAGTVPVDAEMRVRGLFDRGTARELARRAVDVARECSGDAEGGGTFGIEVRSDGMSANPAEVDWDAPLCRELRTAVEEVTGREPSSYRGHLASDIRFPIRIAGVPAVGLGSIGGDFYSPGEWVDVDDLVRCVAVLLLAIHRLAPGGG